MGFGGRIFKWPYWRRNEENKNLIDQHLVYSPEDHFPFLVTWEMSEILKLLGKCLLHQIANSSSNLHNKCRVKTLQTKTKTKTKAKAPSMCNFFIHWIKKISRPWDLHKNRKNSKEQEINSEGKWKYHYQHLHKMMSKC